MIRLDHSVDSTDMIPRMGTVPPPSRGLSSGETLCPGATGWRRETRRHPPRRRPGPPKGVTKRYPPSTARAIKGRRHSRHPRRVQAVLVPPPHELPIFRITPLHRPARTPFTLLHRPSCTPTQLTYWQPCTGTFPLPGVLLDGYPMASLQLRRTGQCEETAPRAHGGAQDAPGSRVWCREGIGAAREGTPPGVVNSMTPGGYRCCLWGGGKARACRSGGRCPTNTPPCAAGGGLGEGKARPGSGPTRGLLSRVQRHLVAPPPPAAAGLRSRPAWPPAPGLRWWR